MEAFLFQVCQPESEAAHVVHLDQVRWPDVLERLEALGPLLVEGLLLLVIPTLLQVVVVLLLIKPEVKEVMQPQFFLILVQLVLCPPEWTGG